MGLAPVATQEEIKSRYRTLAKRHHPDIDSSEGAAQKFREISEANSVLSDAMARMLYDAELLLQNRSRERSQASNSGGSTGPVHSSSGGHSPSNSRTSTGTSTGPTTRPTPDSEANRTAKPQPKKTSYRQEAAELAAKAQREFNRLKYREAETLCRSAIKIDRRNVMAHEILGEVLEKRGQKDEAVAEYSVALQLDPTNYNLQRKFDKMTGRKSNIHMAGSSNQAGRHTPRPRAEARRILNSFTRLTACIALAFVIVTMILWTNNSKIGVIAMSPLHWNSGLLIRMVAVGVAAGLIIGLSGVCGQITSALQADFGNRSNRAASLFPLMLLLVSVFSVYVGFGIYAITGRTSKGMSTALFSAFLSTIATLILFAAVDFSSAEPILLFGGSVVFPSVIVGWRATGR